LVLHRGGGDTDPRHHSLIRDEHGRFRDEDLAEILQKATAASASAFKARGTPEVLRVVELLSIEQGRIWGTCTVRAPCYNFSRSYLPASVERVPQVPRIET